MWDENPGSAAEKLGPRRASWLVGASRRRHRVFGEERRGFRPGDFPGRIRVEALEGGRNRQVRIWPVRIEELRCAHRVGNGPLGTVLNNPAVDLLGRISMPERSGHKPRRRATEPGQDPRQAIGLLGMDVSGSTESVQSIPSNATADPHGARRHRRVGSVVPAKSVERRSSTRRAARSSSLHRSSELTYPPSRFR
jgi:hypothetical protein